VTGLTAGSIYYFNVIVKDAAGNESVYTRKANPLPPTISITSPSTTHTVAQAGSFSITWTASDPNGLNPSIALYYSATNTGSCSSKTALNTSLTMTGANGSHSWSVGSVTPGTYYVCAVINNSMTSPVT